MTFADFHKQLNTIDFENGENVESLEKYLLACLAQLNLNKDKEPTFELFLSMYDKARNGPCMDFDPSWKELDDPNRKWDSNQSDWDRTLEQFHILAADLIHTREVRSRPGYVGKSYPFEWDSESGRRFYNGTTPNAILKYSATRFIGEYPPEAFEESPARWIEFWEQFEIGISYE